MKHPVETRFVYCYSVLFFKQIVLTCLNSYHPSSVPTEKNSVTFAKTGDHLKQNVNSLIRNTSSCSKSIGVTYTNFNFSVSP